MPHGVCKLSGAEHLYRTRVGDYRIIYAVHHEEREVIILYIRHRRSAYRGVVMAPVLYVRFRSSYGSPERSQVRLC
ncbi:type II toxin-antitoxin system RelE family toxin [Methanoculleus chikugoensis]|uniref:type II toxin-antitoxin system RelE family toxin n=1 Tax=Methanoculleus chikugoensis TaxID=118126 RepID=UPI003CC846AF